MWLVATYEHFTQSVIGICPGQDKFAHSYAGLAIWLATTMSLRAPRRSLLPLGVLILVELANECLDRLAYGSWRWPDTLGDVAATLFWPVVLSVALRSPRFGLRT